MGAEIMSKAKKLLIIILIFVAASVALPIMRYLNNENKDPAAKDRDEQWYTYRSINGLYSIEMPSKPSVVSDSSAILMHANEANEHVISALAINNETALFSVSYFKYDTDIDIDEIDKYINRYVSIDVKYSIVSTNYIENNMCPGVDIIMNIEDRIRYVRYIVHQNRSLYVLQSEVPRNLKDSIHNELSRFIGSFAIQRGGEKH